VLPADGLLDATYAYARELATTISPRSLAQTKRQIALDLHRDLGTSVEEAGGLLREMMREPDFAEGVAALNEKRPPRFSG
jgi:enoyl-CoA hydratase/carnithine racemase